MSADHPNSSETCVAVRSKFIRDYKETRREDSCILERIKRKEMKRKALQSIERKKKGKGQLKKRLSCYLSDSR
ncbi:hypothetical protein KDRO_E03710 [Kluyveromyces lactis]|nr:hypothetical protein KDRO_E03710 [Kluyveromyces lactis]